MFTAIASCLIATLMLAACSQPATATTSPVSDTPTTNQQDVVTFAVVGDIMMGTTYPEGNYLPANDGRDLFNDVRQLLVEADVAAGNLEGVLMGLEGKTTKKPGPNTYAFRTPTEYVSNLVDAGFDLLSVANNHAGDFGEPGKASTQKVLKEASIAYSGMRGQCPTAIIERAGKKIGFAAFGHNNGTQSILDYDEVRRVVGDLDSQCDIVVVSFHGGGEGKSFQHVPHKSETCFGENRGDVEKFAHTAIDAGADVVYGHGPHVTRALELYNDRLILYSLGNFCTPYRMNLDGVNGYAPVVTLTTDGEGKFIEGRINSFIQQRGIGPRKDDTNSVAMNMRRLTLEDFPQTGITIAEDGTITRK